MNILDLLSSEVRILAADFESNPTVANFTSVLDRSASKAEISYAIGLVAPLREVLTTTPSPTVNVDTYTAYWQDICAFSRVFRLVRLQERSRTDLTPAVEPDSRPEKVFEAGRKLGQEVAEIEATRTNFFRENGMAELYQPRWIDLFGRYHKEMSSLHESLRYHPGRSFHEAVSGFFIPHSQPEAANDLGDEPAQQRKALEASQVDELLDLWSALCERFASTATRSLDVESGSTNFGHSAIELFQCALAYTLRVLGHVFLVPSLRTRDVQLASLRTMVQPLAALAPAMRGETHVGERSRLALDPFLISAASAMLTQLHMFSEDKQTDTAVADFVRCSLQLAPYLPPDIVTELIPLGLNLHAVEHDEDEGEFERFVEGLVRATCCGKGNLMSNQETLREEELDADVSELLNMLADHSAPLAAGVVYEIGAWIPLYDYLPEAWEERGWQGDPEVNVGVLFRYVQTRLLAWERTLGGRTPFSYSQLTEITSAPTLPPATEAVSASWALAQVLAIENLGVERLMDRGRDYTRVVSRLRSAGLQSLATSAHCFFMTSQAISLFEESPRPTQHEFAQSNPCFVDDWAMFSENAAAVAASSARNQLAHCANCAATILERAGMAFEARQLLVYGSDTEGDNQSLNPSAETVLRQASSPAYKQIDDRLSETLGADVYRSLPERVRDALREAERLHDLASGDAVFLRAPSTGWVLEYAKIVELLLRQRLGFMWDPAMFALTRECYEAQNRRPLTQHFSPGAALRLLRSISKGYGTQLRAELVRQGVDIDLLGGSLGREVETFVLRIRNLQAHEARILPDDATRCRAWVLRNMARVLHALSLHERQ